MTDEVCCLIIDICAFLLNVLSEVNYIVTTGFELTVCKRFVKIFSDFPKKCPPPWLADEQNFGL